VSPGAALTTGAKNLLRALRGKRNPRRLLLQDMPKNSVCAEIGVWKGDFSELIRTVTSPEKLHLIDPWEFQDEFPERMYGGAVAKGQRDMDSIYEDVKKRFAKYPNIILHRGKSEDVLQEFANAYFDWVYIDGNHYYEYVMKDLETSYSKVKLSGFITGDDYVWGKKEGFPVRKAVRDFMSAKKMKEKCLTVIESQFCIKL
jgi:hypothetical protein